MKKYDNNKVNTNKEQLKIETWILFFFVSSLTYLIFDFFLKNINVGPELSDSSYYIIRSSMPHAVVNQLTMFGILWYSFFGEQEILINRQIHIIVIFLSGCIYTAVLTNIFKIKLDYKTAGFSILGGLGFLSYFNLFLLDPSYNSLNIVAFVMLWISFVSLLNASFVKVDNEKKYLSKQLIFSSYFLGVAFQFIIMIKITTAFAVFISIVFIYIYHLVSLVKNTPHQLIILEMKKICLIIAAGLFGAFSVLLWLWLRFEAPLDLFERFLTGLKSNKLMSFHDYSFFGELFKLFSFLVYVGKSYIKFGLPAIFWAVGMIFCAYRLLSNSKSLYFKNEILAFLIVITGVWFWVSYPIWLSEDNKESLGALTVLNGLFTLQAILTLYFYGRNLNIVTLSLCLLAFMGPYILTSGTGGSWNANILYSLGLNVSMMIATISLLPIRGQKIGIFSAIILITIGSLISWSKIEHNSYRLSGKLSQANVYYNYGKTGEEFKAPASLAKTYLMLSPFKQIQKNETAPMLIDLTGRAPGVGLFLGLRPPKSAWILSGYPGSDKLLSFFLTHYIEKNDLKNAWLLIPDKKKNKPLKYSLSIDILNRHLELSGKKYPDDYLRLVNVPVSYIKNNATLYRPKNKNN